MRNLKPLEQVAERIEQADALDSSATRLSTLLRKVIRPGIVEDALSGTPIGHPLHPALVAVPIGAWASAGVMDLMGDEVAARRLIGFGCLAALPTAATGASDWLSTEKAEKRVGFVHALANYAAIGAYSLSWWVRHRNRRGAGIALSVVGATALGAAGWLGGHLAYGQGVGVDTTAFQKLPTDWTDVGSDAELAGQGEVTVVDAEGVPVLVSKRSGGWVAFADRCTHRGAPLHEGTVEDGCIVCPWHNSAFALADGSVQAGPATRPQPLLNTRVVDGRLQVKRAESRALRTNPTGL